MDSAPGARRVTALRRLEWCANLARCDRYHRVGVTPHPAHPAHDTAQLGEDTSHIAAPSMSPALDCADRAGRLWTNIAAADADLTRRARVRMILQAVCYAAYANELLGLDNPLKKFSPSGAWRASARARRSRLVS